MRRKMVRLGLAAGLMLLAGCTGIATLPDGRAARLTHGDHALRAALQVTPRDLPARLVYRPGPVCRYVQFRQYVDGQTHIEDQTIQLTPVRDRLLVTVRGRSGVSTALIGPTGKLFDFNLVDPLANARTTTENYSERSAGRLNELAPAHGRALHVINELILLAPEFSSSARYPDAAVAMITREDGGLWGEFVYRGVTSHQGAEVYLFDIVRTFETLPGAGPVVVGFSLVDPATMLPVHYVLDVGSVMRLTRTRCD